MRKVLTYKKVGIIYLRGDEYRDAIANYMFAKKGINLYKTGWCYDIKGFGIYIANKYNAKAVLKEDAHGAYYTLKF